MPEQYTLEELLKMGATPVKPAALDSAPIGDKKSYTLDELQKMGAAPVSKPLTRPLLESRKAASKSEFEANKPESTVGTRSREASIGVLEPFTAESLRESGKTVLGFIKDMFTGAPLSKALPLFEAPAAPVVNWAKGFHEGDYDKAAYGAGGMLSQTVPAIAGAVESVAGPIKIGPEIPKIPDIAGLKDKAREVAQRATGSSAFKVTEPIVDKYLDNSAKAKQSQVDADAAVSKKNLENRQAAQRKNIENQHGYEADVKASEATAAEKTSANQNKAAAELEANRLTGQSNARSESVTRSLKEGSQKLGERVKDLDVKVRAEAGGKYGVVRSAVRDDLGVPLKDLGEDARHAESNILKGSSENIKQFRELARKSAEEQSGPHTNIGFDIYPGSPLFDRLLSEGAIDTGGNITFDQLQGYSSEIGSKLAKGGLQGDVYQALKYLKGKIDAAKTIIAERNGVGVQLREADSFWHQYMDTFYDSDSAVAKVRESVGSVDPEYYADPFTKGKAGDVAIGKLKQLKTQHSADASAVADLARNLRSAHGELSGIKTGTVKPVDPPARVSPKDIEPPKPVATKPVPKETASQPKAPTAKDITDTKRQKILEKGQSFAELRPRDAYVVAGPLIAGLLGNHWLAGLVSGLGIEGAVKGVGYALSRPRIVEWIAKPTPADLAAIEKLPEPTRTAMRTELKKIVDQEKSSGRNIQVDPAIERLISQAGVVANRQEGLDLFKQ